MIYQKPPKNFKANVEVVSCFFEHNGEILLLKRALSRPQGGTWGIPAGKIEKGESLVEALKRELWEETGISLSAREPKYFEKFYVKYPDLNFVFHIFHFKTETRPEVKINPREHDAYVWRNPRGALKENLIPDFGQCIKVFYKL